MRIRAPITVAVTWLLVAVIAGSGTIAAAANTVSLTFSIERIDGPDWSVDDIVIEIQSNDSASMEFALRAARLALPGERSPMRDLRFRCPDVRRLDSAWACESGSLDVMASPFGKQQATWAGHYRDDGSLEIAVEGLQVAAGTLRTAITLTADAWHAGVRLYRLNLDTAARLAGLDTSTLAPGLVGHASGNLEIAGKGSELTRIAVDLVVEQLAFASPDETRAAEDVVVKIDSSARHSPVGWQFDGKLRWPRGGLYLEPLYIDAGAGALEIDLSGVFSSQHRLLRLDGWSASFDKALTISGAVSWDTQTWRLIDLTLAGHSQATQRLYDVFVQPYLIGTSADELDVGGQVGFALHFDDEGPELAGLELRDFSLRDRRERFALAGTDGTVAWHRDGNAQPSSLAIGGARWLQLEFGPFDVAATLLGDQIELQAPVAVDLLGGAVTLEQFALTGAELDSLRPRWQASASVSDVSLELLTRDLGWPPFSGQVSGALRDLNYAEGLLRLGGELEVNAFDGRIVVHDLQIREPLGLVPVLDAEVTMRGLSLDALTSTFDFGRIQGRLDGDLAGLQMVAWQPAAFDLHLYTPPGDESRRRISQRAVENLTELGSGLPAGLTGSFLSVFEEFAYDVIDVKILLRGRAADISGLARKDGGYYLVRGSGLPRIDVIGRNRSVDWNDLLARLRDIRIDGVSIQ
jgi:hypothetical protein